MTSPVKKTARDVIPFFFLLDLSMGEQMRFILGLRMVLNQNDEAASKKIKGNVTALSFWLSVH
jgi:hypothetical protein